MFKKDKSQKKISFTKKSCIGLMVLCTVIGLVFMVGGAAIAEIFHLSSMLLYAGEVIGVVLCIYIVREQTGIKLSSAVQTKGFDFTVPVMVFLFDWGFISHIMSHIVGFIGSHITTVKPVVSDEGLLEFIVGSVIAAPVCEELLFRFCNISVLKQKFGRIFTIIVTGSLFSLIHMYNIQGFIQVMMGGILYAYIFMTTGNLLYTMAAHAMHNALCLLPTEKIMLGGTPMLYNVGGFDQCSVPYLIINAVLAAAALVYYFRYFRPKFCTVKSDAVMSSRIEGIEVI